MTILDDKFTNRVKKKNKIGIHVTCLQQMPTGYQEVFRESQPDRNEWGEKNLRVDGSRSIIYKSQWRRKGQTVHHDSS